MTFKGDKIHNEIADRIAEFTDELMLDYQLHYGIEYGDIQPLDALKLEEATDKLAETITSVLEYEFTFCR